MLEEKIEHLSQILNKLGSFIIAYSGGVDSTLILAVAASIPGIKVLAVTISNPMIPGLEIRKARMLTRELKIKHKILRTDPLSDPALKSNPENRCYICKKSIFIKLLNLARENGYRYVVDGTNYDDLKSYRPGMRALKELGIESPLVRAGFTKDDIRKYSRRLGLSTWNDPALACLATRIPYNENITEAKLNMINESEEFIRSLGFRQVRVRYNYPVARIELGQNQIPAIVKRDIRMKVVKRLKAIGFDYITIDLEGYRTGSMDEQKD